MSQTYRKLNYRRAPEDERDFPYKHLMHLERVKLPDKVDLTSLPYYPGVYDQGEIGSCTAQAACALKEFITRRYVRDYPAQSRLGFYFCERDMQGDTENDTGSDGRTSGEVMLNVGVADESIWPYDERELKTRPSYDYYSQAYDHKIGAYFKLEGEYQLKKCLATGFPFVLGMYCPKQMMDDRFGGYLQDLKQSDMLIENGYPAGHQVSCFGYEQIKGRLYFKLRNSWGEGWGLKGHFYLETSVMTSDWVADCYTYRLAKEPGI